MLSSAWDIWGEIIYTLLSESFLFWDDMISVSALVIFSLNLTPSASYITEILQKFLKVLCPDFGSRIEFFQIIFFFVISWDKGSEEGTDFHFEY